MEKQLKDYLHLHLGCQVQYDPNEGALMGVHGMYCVMEIKAVGLVKIQRQYYSQLKLILRHLNSVTDEEKRQCDIDSNLIVNSSNHIEAWAARINWFRKRFVDVDGLIEAGLAIDKTKIGRKEILPCRYVCSSCGGHGSVDYGKGICENCNGTGEILQ